MMVLRPQGVKPWAPPSHASSHLPPSTLHLLERWVLWGER